MAIGIGTAVAIGAGATIGAVKGFFAEDSPWREIGSDFQRQKFGSPNAIGRMTEGTVKSNMGIVSYHSPRRGPVQGPGAQTGSQFGQRTNMRPRPASQPVSGDVVRGMWNRRRG